MTRLVKLSTSSIAEYGLSVYLQRSFSDDRGELVVDFEGSVDPRQGELTLKTSTSPRGVGRGLHLQEGEHSQEKIIFLKRGRIIDLIYDPTNHKDELYYFYWDEGSPMGIKIPSNYAHGFITLTPAIFQYICIGAYNERAEKTYNFIPAVCKALGLGDVLLSVKDRSHPELKLVSR